MARVRIQALLGRAPSGISIRPFICEDERGRIFYVKPFGNLPSSLISEWLAARLATELGLPLPAHDIVEVPAGMGAGLAGGHAADFRAGPAFASESLGSGASDLLPHDIGRIRPDLLAEALVFDAWVRNADRILGPSGGNPNAMMVSPGSRFFLIDHDNAFDEAFDPRSLLLHHPGKAEAAAWLDAGRRADWTGRARNAFDKFGEFWQELPPEWLERDGEPCPDIAAFRARALDILRRPFDCPADFWKPLEPFSA